MSQQIQITGGAKVRDLNDVIIGTNGVLSSLAFNVANGVPKLDSNGKILVSQLPNSVMEYLGTWNAATNTPTLANGVGNQGDVYLCNVAGTVNFGAGPITFAVGDTAIYSGSIWQKAGGATGTVTSVGLSTSGNAFTIGSSPVTTSGTITINGAGTASQYINGAGNLTTFPTLITSIGLSMPSAFSVSNSPLTANGTISVTGAGTVSQYIDGTGALQSFPSLTGYVPYVGATTDVDLGVHVLNAQALHVKGTAGAGHLGLKHQTATPTGSANESLVFANVDGDLGWQNGNLYSTILNTHSNTANRVYTFPNASGTLALTSDINYPVTSVFGRTGAVTAQSGDYSTTLVTEGTNLYYTDARARAALSFVAGSGAYNSTTGVITIPTNNNQITNGANYITLTSLSATTPLSYNNTTGAFSISQASTTVSGYLSSTDFTTFSNKQSAITLTTTGTSGAATFVGNTLNIPNYNPDLSGYVTLGTNQTISGSKTFSVQTNFNAAIYVQNAQPLYLLNSGNTYQIGLFASLGLSGNRTIYFPNADGTLALTSQLTSGTVTSVAALTLGTSGTDLSSTVANSTTTPVITLNVPDASATARGVITTGTQTIAGNKTFTGLVTTYGHNINKDATTGYGLNLQSMGSLSIAGTGYVSLTSNSTSALNIYYNGVTNSATLSGASLTAGRTFTFPDSSGTFALTSDLSSYVPTTRTISTTAPLQGGGDLSANRTLSITQATTSTNGYLSSTDWNTFNGKQNALTNPVTGTGTSGQVTYFNGTTSVTSSSNLFWDNTNARLGIGNSTPSYTLDVSGTGRFKASGNSYSNGSIILTNSSGATSTYMTNSGGIFYLSNNGTTDHLQISSSGAATFSSSVGINGVSATYPLYVRTGTNQRARFVDNGGIFQMAVLNDAESGYSDMSLGNSAIVIKSGGNVGIGTTSPNSYGGFTTLNINNATNGGLIDLLNNGTRVGTFFNTSTDVNFGSITSVPLIFYTANTERMRITSAGQIYNSNAPAGDWGMRVFGNSTAGSSYGFKVLGGTNSSDDSMLVTNYSGGTAYLRIRGDGAFYTGSGSNSPMNATTGNAANVYIDNTDVGRLYRSTSSIKYKKDVINYTRGLNEVMQLRPVFYKGISDNDGDKQFAGLIAEEVDELGLTEFVQYAEDGSPDALAYQNMVALLVKAIQEQNQLIEDLKSRLDKAGL